MCDLGDLISNILVFMCVTVGSILAEADDFLRKTPFTSVSSVRRESRMRDPVWCVELDHSCRYEQQP